MGQTTTEKKVVVKAPPLRGPKMVQQLNVSDSTGFENKLFGAVGSTSTPRARTLLTLSLALQHPKPRARAPSQQCSTSTYSLGYTLPFSIPSAFLSCLHLFLVEAPFDSLAPRCLHRLLFFTAFLSCARFRIGGFPMLP